MAESQLICSVDVCCNPAYLKGFCNAHYIRFKRHGSPLAGGPLRKPTKDADGKSLQCAVKGCESAVEKKGFCSKHYTREKRHGNPCGGSKRASNAEIQNWVRNLLTTKSQECVIWPFGVGGAGYGSWRLGEKRMPASRAVLILATGQNPTDKDACHGPCNDRRCVNPQHLSWKDRKGNVRDRVRDGTNSSKLTADAVSEIRASSERGIDLAKRFNVSPSYISDLRKGRGWHGV